MDKASKKYFHPMISIVGVFMLLMNAGISVSGKDNPGLILIDYGDGLDFPMCARRSSTGYGNYNAMDFTKKNSPATLPSYYCPLPKNLEKNFSRKISDIEGCLVSTYSACDKEVKPLMKMVKSKEGRRIACGITRNSELYMVGYRICTPNDAKGKTKDFMKEIYRFCFEKPVDYPKYISYIEYRIISPTLLQNDALKEERIFEYILTDDTYNNSDYSLDSLKSTFQDYKYGYDHYTINDTTDAILGGITLAPPKDMPFRILRKPFLHGLNARIAKKKVIEEWNNIGLYIRKKAAHQLGQVKIVVGESTVKEQDGFSKFLTSSESGEKIWWKIVYTEEEYFGMAIIFHTSFNWLKPPVKLCERSLCEEYGWTNMISDHLKAYVYCCHSDVISKDLELKNAPFPLRLVENFQSLFHMSESGCHDIPIQGEPALINIHDWRKSAVNSLPVCARELTPTNDLVYTAPLNSDDRNEYYCPPATEVALYLLEMNSDGKYNGCLFPNPGQYQYCARPVQPVIIQKPPIGNQVNRGCVSGVEYSQFYLITYKVTSFLYHDGMYTICYNHDFQRTEYIEYRIHSPRLLKNPLLEKERDFIEELKIDSYNIFNDDFKKLRDSYNTILPTDEAGFQMTKNFLVPPQHMAFRVWKRATFHYINVKLMWPYWVEVWNSINQYLLDVAAELFWEMEIKTGVLHLENPSPSTVWWKLIHVEYRMAIAIILHNVPLNTPVETLCAPNICQYYNWHGMIPDDKKDYVYCCQPEVITDRLGMHRFPSILDRNSVTVLPNEYKNKAMSCENMPATKSYNP